MIRCDRIRGFPYQLSFVQYMLGRDEQADAHNCKWHFQVVLVQSTNYDQVVTVAENGWAWCRAILQITIMSFRTEISTSFHWIRYPHLVHMLWIQLEHNIIPHLHEAKQVIKKHITHHSSHHIYTRIPLLYESLLSEQTCSILIRWAFFYYTTCKKRWFALHNHFQWTRLELISQWLTNIISLLKRSQSSLSKARSHSHCTPKKQCTNSLQVLEGSRRGFRRPQSTVIEQR
jgi:hypothetical protein